MLELAILLCLLMAHRKGGYPSKGRYSLRPVRFAAAVALLTTGNNVVVGNGLTGAADGPYRMITVIGTWALRGLTAGEGPITVGYAHSNYTVTEIKESIESGTAISIGLKVEQERANRLVRIVGTFPGNDTEEALNHGEPIKTRLNWAIPVGVEVDIFAYNDSGGTLTTGAQVEHTGKCWVKDNL